MSKYNSVVEHTVYQDIKTLSILELEVLYGLEINDDEVFDVVDGQSYKNLTEWADTYIEFNEESNLRSFSKIGNKQNWEWEE